jgi:hypothetical protein
MKKLTWLPLFAIYLAALAFTLSACNGDDDDDTVADDDDATADDDDDATAGDDDDDDATADDDDAAGDCILDGTWALTTFECETYDITADWFAVMDSTIMEIGPGAVGCDVLLTNSSASCVEVMQTIFEIDGDTVTGENLGIVSCTPDACTFTPDDDPCVVGEGAGDMGASAFTLDGDVLVVTGHDPDGICGKLEMIQTWARQ